MTAPIPARSVSAPPAREWDGHTRVLELIARGAPLLESLGALVRVVEQENPDVTCAICIFDVRARVIEDVVGPSLPADFRARMVGLPVDHPESAPCARVLADRTAVLVEDIAGDPAWTATPWAREVFLAGYRQCRSTPVFGSDGRVGATFVLLASESGNEALTDATRNESAAYLASIAITRAHHERRLRDKQQRLRMAVEGAELGAWDWNLRSGEIEWSARCRELFGITGDGPLRYEDFRGALHPDDRDRVDAAVRATLEEGDAFDVEYRAVWPDGSVRWIAAKGRAFPADDGGEPAFMRGIALDITERKRGEAALAEAEGTLRLAVEATGLGLWDWDPVRNEGMQDARCQEIFDYPTLDYEGWRERLHPDDRERAEAVFSAALAGEGDETFVNNFRVVRRDGEVRWIRGFGRVVFEEREGRRRAVRVIGANLDLTESHRAAQEAQDNAERFRFLAESLPHKIFTATPDGETDYFNGQWATYTALPVNEVLRVGWREFVHPDDREEKQARWVDAVKNGEPFEFEHRLRRADGDYRWHLTRAKPLRRADGRIAMWIGSNTDIDDLKRAQFDLEVRESRFRVMADATPVLIWLADISRECTYFNRQWLEFTGRTLEEERGHGWIRSVHPDDLPQCQARYFSAFDRREPFAMEYRLRRADGEYRWVLDRGEPLLEPDGSFVGYIGGCFEIHEQKELEHLLREAESRARLAMEAAGMGFWDWQIGGGVQWSPEHNRVLGLDPAQVEGSYQDFMERVIEEDRNAVASAIRRALESQEDLAVEFRVRGADDSVRWIAGHGRAFHDEVTGQPYRMIGVVRDVTGEKRSQADLLRNQEELRTALAAATLARDEAEAAGRTKDQFLAVLSHELRTPLTPVLMAVSMLQTDKGTPAELRPIVDMIHRNIKVEARLIDDLLDLTRITRNKLEFHREVTDLHFAVRQAVEICRADIDAKPLLFELRLEASRHHVHGDPARLQQVFWNIIKNAVKFTPVRGRIEVTSRNIDADHVRIEVRDTGVGIAPQHLSRIFRPFEQGDSSRARQFGGLGLGLAISLATIEAHHGRIHAESAGENQGATFTVELETCPPPHVP